MRMINRLARLIGTWMVGRRREGAVLAVLYAVGLDGQYVFFLFAVMLSANDQTSKEIVHSNINIFKRFSDQKKVTCSISQQISVFKQIGQMTNVITHPYVCHLLCY